MPYCPQTYNLPSYCPLCGTFLDGKNQSVDHIIAINNFKQKQKDILNVTWLKVDLCNPCHTKKTDIDNVQMCLNTFGDFSSNHDELLVKRIAALKQSLRGRISLFSRRRYSRPGRWYKRCTRITTVKQSRLFKLALNFIKSGNTQPQILNNGILANCIDVSNLRPDLDELRVMIAKELVFYNTGLFFPQFCVSECYGHDDIFDIFDCLETTYVPVSQPLWFNDTGAYKNLVKYDIKFLDDETLVRFRMFETKFSSATNPQHILNWIYVKLPAVIPLWTRKSTVKSPPNNQLLRIFFLPRGIRF